MLSGLEAENIPDSYHHGSVQPMAPNGKHGRTALRGLEELGVNVDVMQGVEYDVFLE